MKRAALLLSMLMCLGLIGTFARGQGAPTAPGAPAFVDTREECTALGGAWLAPRDNWRASCQVPWGREECLRLGGDWSALAAAPGGGFCIAQVSQSATVRQCTASGGTWGPPGSAMPLCQPGPGRARPPAKKASDAGNACSGQSDCIYGCVYRGPAVAPGTDVPGVCRALPQSSGCDEMVARGKLAGTICKK